MTTNTNAAQTWTKVDAGHYTTADKRFTAIKDSDGTGWALWNNATNTRIAFVGTYKQARDAAVA